LAIIISHFAEIILRAYIVHIRMMKNDFKKMEILNFNYVMTNYNNNLPVELLYLIINEIKLNDIILFTIIF
jgi:hypothetical protein